MTNLNVLAICGYQNICILLKASFQIRSIQVENRNKITLPRISETTICTFILCCIERDDVSENDDST